MQRSVRPLTTAILFITAALPSIWLSWMLPPLYVDLTTVWMATAPGGSMPHYPPLYAVLAWSLHKLANTACGLPDGYSDCGLYATVVVQHVLLTAAVVYFVSGCASSLAGRVAAVIPFWLLPVFALVNHGFQTEAVWISCLIVLLGATIRAARAETAGWGPLAFALVAATAALLIRQTSYFLLPVVPVTLGLRAVCERTRHSLSRLATGSAVMLLAVGISLGTVWAAMTLRGTPYRAVWGRGTIEVIQRIVVRLESAGGNRQALLPRLEAAATDPVLRHALPTIVTYLDANYAGDGKAMVWGGAHAALIRSGSKDANGTLVPVDSALADHLANEFCLLFFKVYPHLALEHAAATMRSYLSDLAGPPPNADAPVVAALQPGAGAPPLSFLMTESSRGINSLMAEMTWRITDLLMAKDKVEWISGMENTSTWQHYQAQLDAHRTLLADPLFRILWRLPNACLVLVLAVLLIAGFSRRRPTSDAAIFSIGAVVSGLILIAAASALLAYIPRYQIPFQLLIAAAVSAAAGGLWPVHGRSRSAGSIRARGPAVAVVPFGSR